MYHLTPTMKAISEKKKEERETSIGKDVKKLEPLDIASGNVSLRSCCGRQPGSSKVQYRIDSAMTQQSHC